MRPDESTYLETTASLEEEPVAATAPVAPPIAVPLRGGGTKAVEAMADAQFASHGGWRTDCSGP